MRWGGERGRLGVSLSASARPLRGSNRAKPLGGTGWATAWPGRDVHRHYHRHIDPNGALATSAQEPAEQRRLAVAPRPDQHDVVRRGPTANQVRKAQREDALLLLAPGKRWRRRAIARGEQPILASFMRLTHRIRGVCDK